jgi:hypothetical protein
MRHVVRPLLIVIVLLVGGVGPVLAHHSYVLFDRTQLVKVEATIAKIEWKNPHVHFWAYVKNDKGTQDLYAFESGSVASLARRGWTATSFAVNEKVTIYTFPLKNGDHGGYFVQAKKADGTVLIGDEAAYMQLPGETAPPPQPPKE